MIYIDVIEYEIGAGISGVAQEYPRRQDSSMYVDIPQSDSINGNQGIRGTVLPRQWEQERAPSGVASGLVLLLRPDPNSPPDGVIDIDVLVHNIGDLSSSVGAGVGLDVDGLEGHVEHDVPDGHVADAGMVVVGRHRPDAHPHSVLDGAVLNQQVLRAVGVNVLVAVGGLDCHCVIEVLDGHVPEHDVPAPDIDSVGVQGEGRDPPEEAFFVSDVHVDDDVLHGHVEHVVEVYVVLGTVFHGDAVDQGVFGVPHLQQHWPIVLRGEDGLPPPQVALAVDEA